MMKYIEIVYAESVQFKTRPDDVLSFSNLRLLHGRSGYTDTSDNVRHLVGIYLDWDQIYSRWRVLINSKNYKQEKIATNT